jgi:hypothetical protein
VREMEQGQNGRQHAVREMEQGRCLVGSERGAHTEALAEKMW